MSRRPPGCPAGPVTVRPVRLPGVERSRALPTLTERDGLAPGAIVWVDVDGRWTRFVVDANAAAASEVRVRHL